MISRGPLKQVSNSIKLDSGLLVHHRIVGQQPLGVAVFPDFLSLGRTNHYNHFAALTGLTADHEIEPIVSTRKLMQELLDIGLDCVTPELLTDREISEHRLRTDLEKLSSRLSLSLSILKNGKEYHDLPFALITGTNGLKCCLLTLRRQPAAAHALVCFCDPSTDQNDIDAIPQLRIPALLVGRSENHPGAPGCLSLYQAETSRRISVWLRDELIRERQNLVGSKKSRTYV